MPPKPPRELVQVSQHLRQDQADERGLSLLAQGLDYWILDDDGVFAIYVDSHDAEVATAELERFETERAADLERQRQVFLQNAIPTPNGKTGTFSLFAFTWFLCLCFAVQAFQGSWWTELGTADSQAILNNGQWWRVVTALTLHADLGHLFANVATGLVFAWALLPLLGSGWTWIGFLGAGAMGNALNALIHKGGQHLSIGASTAVFGALGLLVGWQLIDAIFHPDPALHSRRWRDTLIPLAAGFALLAYLGVGSGTDNVDIMAHGLGLLSGILLGCVLAATRLPDRTSPRIQKLLAAAACALPILSWAWALGTR